MRIGYTIGGMMVFPGNHVDGKMTINGSRMPSRIRDRFDLTLECVRRYYANEPSPLSKTLALYADFFGLFGDLEGYVDFFFLEDLVNQATSTVKFMMPFEDFNTSPLPDGLLRTWSTADSPLSSSNRAISESPIMSVLKLRWARLCRRTLLAGRV